MGTDVAANVEGHPDKYLPEDDTVSRKNQQEEHEAKIAQNNQHVLECGGDAGGLLLLGAGRLPEEEERGPEHEENAESGNAKNALDAPAQLPAHQEGDNWAERSADVDDGVVD